MENLAITRDNALTAYKEADEKGKILLVNLFGKEIFTKTRFSSYIDIKTLADAMEFLGDEDEFVRQYADLAEINLQLPKDVLVYYKLRIIIKAINGGVVMNDNDTKVYRYYPYFNATGSSDGFSFIRYFSWSSVTSVPSRLCFLDSDRAVYAGKQFTEIYKDFLS